MSRSLAGDVITLARQRPEAPALLCSGAQDQAVSYAELVEECERVGAELDARYPDAGRPLALQAAKSAVALATVLACMRAGRPLLLASTELGRDLLADLVARSGCQAVLGVADDALTHRPVAQPDESLPPVPEGTSLLLTTSGSTGTPKLVPLSGDAVDAFTAWAGTAFSLGAGTRVLNFAPLNFDLCLLDIWATLRHGGCVVPVEQDRSVDPKYLIDLLETARPEIVQAVPMFFRLLTEAGVPQDFPSVRDVLLTGDHVHRSVRSGLSRLFPRARFHNVYGCTETNDSMLHTFTAEEAAALDVLPLGGPLPGVQVEVLVDGEVLSGAGTGELLVRTPFQTTGYLGDAAKDRFPVRDGRAWYRTGDVVTRSADGGLALVGRTDSQVKVRGVRINLEEVERVLNSHENVAEAAVVAVPDPAAGRLLHAFVRRHDETVTGLQLRSYCAAKVNRAAIPAAFHLVTDALPIGPTGKVSRRLLLERLA
ncbi:AMP-binding protein [Streptomyces sp. SL13]|uniref:AMP-binding protein n=1 Tax=Streptantibioticus silvisoli TaxID=2705255 RepID=A0AA90GZ16_9ACTN|nr:AMP-binding protein [Streptantibioticus silvisoli]MDI5964587.1 AMP-binding protein [Streptantibioticus silvisoli]MDI5970908.1 AMP-binding protein [Streptantibioticus silvisoli]